MLPFHIGWQFPSQICHLCNEPVQQEDAVAVWGPDLKAVGWAHERDCTKDDA